MPICVFLSALNQNIEFVGHSSHTSGGIIGQSSMSYPAGAAVGDVAWLFGQSDTGAISEVSTPAGWTRIYDAADASPYATGFRQVISSTAAFNISFPGGDEDDYGWMMVVFRNVDTVTPHDANQTYANGAIQVPDGASITTVTPGAYVFVMGFLDDEIAAASGITAPAGYGDVFAINVPSGGCIMYADKYKATAGAENPGVFGSASANDTWHAVTFAARPANP